MNLYLSMTNCVSIVCHLCKEPFIVQSYSYWLISTYQVASTFLNAVTGIPCIHEKTFNKVICIHIAAKSISRDILKVIFLTLLTGCPFLSWVTRHNWDASVGSTSCTLPQNVFYISARFWVYNAFIKINCFQKCKKKKKKEFGNYVIFSCFFVW